MELCKSSEMQCQRLVVCFWPENAGDGVVTRRPRLAADGNCEHVSAPRSLTFSFSLTDFISSACVFREMVAQGADVQ